MTTTREITVITDETTRAELREALTHLCHAAKREFPRTNTTGVLIGWDRRHAAINDVLDDLDLAES